MGLQGVDPVQHAIIDGVVRAQCLRRHLAQPVDLVSLAAHNREIEGIQPCAGVRRQLGRDGGQLSYEVLAQAGG